MPNAHLSLGIAQLILYIPIVPLAIFLAWRNRSGKPRMAWFSLSPFGLMRFAGGIITILYQNSPSTGLFIADLVLLNVGTIPLIVVDAGCTGTMCFKDAPFAARVQKALRVAFIAAASLLSAGAAVSGTSSRGLTRSLTLAGYAVFSATLVALMVAQLLLLLLTERPQMDRGSRKILYSALAASPFLVVRNVYGLLEVGFELDADSVWNPVTGSARKFAVMALLMEYIAVMPFLYAGFSVHPARDARPNSYGL
ncbi:hypothetical protein SPI_06349 [Niveomyces insectorum RCEF 264]|uniref:DUF7702 domain-containing protein n=1 Tax=Niveomyces insectorum RCEF 264 TaxID=1081102 RepID=A0A167S1Q8_9HYPO|nr:hypothetical protein SPI_06349 [Niveomyces insectorum RCEF 264]